MKSIFIFLLLFVSLQATKISEITKVVGVRENQLIGYSLVVGLNKTGDGTTSIFTLQSIANMLKAMNIDMNPNDIKSKNVAAVVVTARLSSFSHQGDAMDVTVSAIGDAKSIEGGTLLMTPLKGVDGKIYALAQGSVSIGGKNERGGGSLNHATAGIVYGGGIVEREIPLDLYHQEYVTLSLKNSSFANAVNLQNAINGIYHMQVAVALDPKSIKLKRPENKSMVEFLAEVQELDVAYIPIEKIVINERTGTIVAGVNIAVSPIIITHGDITIKIEEDGVAGPGDNIVLDDEITIGLEDNRLVTKKGSSTVANIARSLQKLGATPKDIISILETMKKAGAIQADLEII
ncbi:MAG: flagellar biosynthesis protein FlgI [Arcobacter sp.]|nr:MAG: flagellar biosynthesis protein FlgI [Arcobacter sp.]